MSLDLTSAMTLEAWVYPPPRGGWRGRRLQRRERHRQDLEGSSAGGPPAMGGTFSASPPDRALGVAAQHLVAPRRHIRRSDDAPVRQWDGGGEQAAIGTIAISTGALSIGSDPLYGQYFAGRIDEIRVYNVALSAAEIQTDMNTPIGNQQSEAAPADCADEPDCGGGEWQSDQPQLDSVLRQCLGNRLPGRAMPGRLMHELRTGRDALGNDL